MARETRIGLLVGLFFIVMFGLVLTELTGGGKTAPTPAEAVNDPFKIAALPASEDTSPAVSAPGEVVARLGPRSSTVLKPALAEAPTQTTVAPPVAAPTTSETTSPVAVAMASPAGDSSVTSMQESSLLSALETLPAPAPAASEELTASLKTRLARDVEAPAVAEPAPAETAPVERTYTVAPKDTLRKIARTVYGPDHEKEYRRIFEANKGTLKSESILSVGQKLVIPPLPGGSPGTQGSGPRATEAPGSTRQLNMDELEKHLATAASPSVKSDPSSAGAIRASDKPATKNVRVYVVAPGDNLSKIARKTMGNDRKATILKLRNANRGKLADPQRLAVGTKLEIPG